MDASWGLVTGVLGAFEEHVCRILCVFWRVSGNVLRTPGGFWEAKARYGNLHFPVTVSGVSLVIVVAAAVGAAGRCQRRHHKRHRG
eukprot:3520329-Pyramimonas_sp.AAC.1